MAENKMRKMLSRRIPSTLLRLPEEDMDIFVGITCSNSNSTVFL